jgi:hypothetical protein
VRLGASAEPYETGFNTDYLLQALRTFSDQPRSLGAVSFSGHDLGSPHVLSCDIHETYLLMPMRV